MLIKRFFVVLLVLVMIVTPILVNADDSASSAIIAADRDAKANTSGALWFGAGCLFGLLGVGAAYVMEPSPSSSALLGKSAAYVTSYTDEYKSAGKSIQTKNAWVGCIVGGIADAVVWTIYYFAVMASVSASIN